MAFLKDSPSEHEILPVDYGQDFSVLGAVDISCQELVADSRVDLAIRAIIRPFTSGTLTKGEFLRIIFVEVGGESMDVAHGGKIIRKDGHE